MKESLSQKVVLITGASSGIGEACAREFAAAGASLVLCARRLDLLEALASELSEKFSIRTHVVALDVANCEAVVQSLSDLPVEFKNVDILLNNAGLALGLDSLQSGDCHEWDRMIDVNIKGLLYVTRSILPDMIARNSGHIFNLGSTAGHRTYAGGAVYCATKHAVLAISNALKKDLHGTKIRVSSVSPGAVNTNFSAVRFRGDKEAADNVYAEMEPLTAADVAEIIVFCASRPSHVNISELIVLATDQVSLL